MNIDKKDIEDLINQKIDAGIKQYGKGFKFLVIEILNLEKMLLPQQEAKKEEKIIELSKWNEHYEYPSVGSLRQTYYHRKENGFEYCVEYGGDNGGRILINVAKYHEWRKSRKQTKNRG